VVVGGAIYSAQKLFNFTVSVSNTSRASSNMQFSSMPKYQNYNRSKTEAIWLTFLF